LIWIFWSIIFSGNIIRWEGAVEEAHDPKRERAHDAPYPLGCVTGTIFGLVHSFALVFMHPIIFTLKLSINITPS
jgi:hypothetical protein